VFRVRDLSGAFLDASSFSAQLCWQMRETTSVLRMFCGTNGATIRSECVCEVDLYYDEECVNPARVQQTTCEPETEASISSIERKPNLGWCLVVGTVLHWIIYS
jgi:hypothetical protein